MTSTESITSEEAAKIAGVCKATITNWLRKWDIGVKVHGRLYINRYRLDALLRGLKTKDPDILKKLEKKIDREKKET